MNKDYMVSNIKPFKKAQEQVTAVLDARINQTLKTITQTPEASHVHTEKLYELLLKRKKTAGISEKLKREIFSYFLQRQIREMNFIRLKDKHTLKILKITKIKLKDFKLDWRDIIAKFEDSDEQTQKVAGLYEFLSILRPYYDCNNVIDVFESFKGKYNLTSQMTWFYIEKFANITPQTSSELLKQFIVSLSEYFEMSGLKDMHQWRWLLRIKKKSHELDMSAETELLSNQLLKKFLQIQNKEKGSTQVLNTKFLGSAFASLIGKKNPMSVSLIRMFFETFKNSFVAFMESKQNVKFLAIFLNALKERKTAEDKLRKKILKIEDLKEQQPQQEESEQSEKEDDTDESGISNLVGNYVVISESDTEEEEEDEADVSNKQQRIQKLKLKLSNQLTEEILDALRYNLELYLQDIFFVQSKEACKALGDAYNLFPKLAQKSIDLVMKGVDIPELNVPILMKMTKKLLESLLVHEQRHKVLDDVLAILQAISKIRYIKDGWNTISVIIGNIPVLDDEDCAQVQQSQKEAFSKFYVMKHDQFYEKYSGLIFEAFKRFLVENEAKEKKRLLLQNPFNNLAINSYKFFEKRCISHAVQTYLETHSLYIHYYLELKKIPLSLIDHFSHKNLPTYKSDQMERKLLEIVLACRSINIQEVKRLTEMICTNDFIAGDSQDTIRSIVQMWVYENVYFHSSYKPLKSNLEHMLPHITERGEYHLTNHQRQNIEDHLKEIMNMWNEYYDYVNKFVDEMSKTAEIPSEATETITKMYFQNFDIDYHARKELIWRLKFLKTVMETFPYHKNLFTGNHVLKDVKFEEFTALKDLNEKSIKLLKRLMDVVLNRFPHDHKLISVLKSYAVGLVDCEESEFHLYAMDFKDVKKLIKKSEDEGLSNYYLLNMQVDLKINLMNQAIAFERDRVLAQPLFKYILIMTFHPDESGIPVRDPEINPKLTQLLFDLFKTKIPDNAESNKKKKFQIRLAEVLSEHAGQVKIQMAGQQLVEFIVICMDMIGSSERTVREAYLSALKALIGKIQHTKIDVKLLEEKVLEGCKSGNSKQKLIWSLCLLAASHSGKTVDFSRFYHLFNELLFDEDFLMRKAAIFLNGFVTRLRRNATKKITKVKDLPPYNKKTLEEFEDTGYLRPEHVHAHVLRKKWLKKYKGYNQCEIVEKPLFRDSLQFLNDPEMCLKFLKIYHTDQISSEDELAFMSKKISVLKEITELSDILGWVTKKYSKYVKLRKHQLSSYERLFGERFFKYLFEIDVGNKVIYLDTGYRFFKATKDFIKGCLGRIETLDNQVVVSNYMTMLLNAYEQVWRTAKNQQVEQFCKYVLKELMEKSSGQFWLLFCKITLNAVDQIDFLTEFFQSYMPGTPSYYRAVERLLNIHANRYNKLMDILKLTIQVGEGLANPIVLKLIKALIAFPDKRFIDETEADKCGVLDTDSLLKENKLEKITEHLLIPTNQDFQDYLVSTLQHFLLSEHIDLRKIGGHLLFESINATAELYKSQNSLKLLRRLLGVAVDWMANNKEEFKTEQGHFQGSLSVILSEIYRPDEFKLLLGDINKLLVPLPQTVHYLSTLYKSPYNFIKQPEGDYQRFIERLLHLLENSILYKEVLLCVSGLLYYRKIGKDSLNEPFVLKSTHSETEKQEKHQILENIQKFTSNERYRIVLLMALLLADVHNLRLYDQQLEYILRAQNKQKDKVKLWAKLMVESRGKAELIEEEDTKVLWNKIKSFSNPYFYHA